MRGKSKQHQNQSNLATTHEPSEKREAFLTQGRRHSERSIQTPSPQKRETTPRASLPTTPHAEPSPGASPPPRASLPSAPALSFRRLRPPTPARVTLTAGRPVHLHSDRLTATIVASAGPWRSSCEWWTEHGWLRDEWDVELSDGTLCRLANDGSAWSVDGIYD